MEILIALALICAIASALVAQSKGRSAGAWAFIGFLTGLIGLLIVAVMPPVKAEVAE
jgi:hypothetical protein